MGNFKVYATFNKNLGQTAPSAWKCPKTEFWVPLNNWKFEPSPRPHTHSDPIINKHTEQVKKNYVLIYHDMHWTLCYRSKTLYHTEKWGFGYLGFQQKYRHTHQNRLMSSPVSEKSTYSLQNYICFSPLTSGLESLGHKSAPSDRPWIEAYLSKILASMNGQGLERQKVLTKELWMPLTFPASSLGASAAPQTFTLMPASYSNWTSTSLHSKCFINSFCIFLKMFLIFFLLKEFFKVLWHTCENSS